MKIQWNKVTWYSKTLAVILFIVVLLIGVYVGTEIQKTKEGKSNVVLDTRTTQDAPNTIVVTDQKKTDVVTNTVKPAELPKKEETIVTSKPLAGTCVNNIMGVDPQLYKRLMTSFTTLHPSFTLTEEGNYPSARLYCELNDNTHIASLVYDDTANEDEYAAPNFRVVLFDSNGKILKESPQNKKESVGGEFQFANKMNDVLSFNSRIKDVCYDATVRYTWNLKTYSYSEVQEGGDIKGCEGDI